jgi:undecaprenyl diphosphate synthase
VKFITFYAFSTENWKRPKDEVDAIMDLFEKYLDEVRDFIEENIRICFIGDRSPLRPELQHKMKSVEIDSRHFDSMTLLIAINYGGRDEIAHATRLIAEKAARGELRPETITEETIGAHLYTKELPDVDLMIRPSGELRLSNFLIWQCAYAEYYFTDILWPDFSRAELDKALLDFARRGRRFGGV